MFLKLTAKVSEEEGEEEDSRSRSQKRDFQTVIKFEPDRISACSLQRRLLLVEIYPYNPFKPGQASGTCFFEAVKIGHSVTGYIATRFQRGLSFLEGRRPLSRSLDEASLLCSRTNSQDII